MYKEIVQLRIGLIKNERDVIRDYLQDIFKIYNQCARRNTLDEYSCTKMCGNLVYINEKYKENFNIDLYDEEPSKDNIIPLVQQLILELEEFSDGNS